MIGRAPNTFYLLKPSEDENLIVINRTIRVIGNGDGPFFVLVTDRDYRDDPSGQTQTIVFRESYYGSMNEATAEAERQVSLSLAEGLIHNDLGMI